MTRTSQRFLRSGASARRESGVAGNNVLESRRGRRGRLRYGKSSGGKSDSVTRRPQDRPAEGGVLDLWFPGQTTAGPARQASPTDAAAAAKLTSGGDSHCVRVAAGGNPGCRRISGRSRDCCCRNRPRSAADGLRFTAAKERRCRRPEAWVLGIPIAFWRTFSVKGTPRALRSSRAFLRAPGQSDVVNNVTGNWLAAQRAAKILIVGDGAGVFSRMTSRALPGGKTVGEMDLAAESAKR